MNNLFHRVQGAPWFEKAKEEKILVVGAGGIGSSFLYPLVKTIPFKKVILVDHDTVEEHNIGTQWFSYKYIGETKVSACVQSLRHFLPESLVNFDLKGYRYDGQFAYPIMASGLDNMATRRVCFEAWKKQSNREILIDGRLSANIYQIFVVTPGREDEYEATLVEDSAVDDGPCTFKQSAYFATLIGARMTHVLVNYLTNKYNDDPYCSLPFKIEEMGDLFLINTYD